MTNTHNNGREERTGPIARAVSVFRGLARFYHTKMAKSDWKDHFVYRGRIDLPNPLLNYSELAEEYAERARYHERKAREYSSQGGQK